MVFYSEKQRRWFFANHPRYSYSKEYRANYYSARTGWVWIENLNALDGVPTIDPNVIYLGGGGGEPKREWIDALKNYSKDLENLPPEVRWLADTRTTLILAAILVALLALSGGGGAAVGNAIKNLPQSFKTEIIDFGRSPQFRTHVIRGNLVRAVVKIRKSGGGWAQVNEVIAKFEPYLDDAAGLARWALRNAH